MDTKKQKKDRFPYCHEASPQRSRKEVEQFRKLEHDYVREFWDMGLRQGSAEVPCNPAPFGYANSVDTLAREGPPKRSIGMYIALRGTTWCRIQTIGVSCQ